MTAGIQQVFVIGLQVTDIEARSALIQLTPPDCDVPDMEMDVADCKYELLLSDKGRDAKYKAVFW